MAVSKGKGGSSHRTGITAVTMIMAIQILINADFCGAAVLVKSNTTYGCISGRVEECLIAEDLELELLEYHYSSHLSRVLAQKTIKPGASQKAGDPTVVPCDKGKYKPYNCDPNYNPKINGVCRHIHDRSCNRKTAN